MTTDTATRGRLTGEHHADTADLTVDDIAARLVKNLRNIQYDGLLPADAEFSVTADNAGDRPVLRVTVTCDTHRDRRSPRRAGVRPGQPLQRGRPRPARPRPVPAARPREMW